MKISDILLSFLLQHRRLALPGLGTFSLMDSAYVLPDEGKQPVLPPGSIAFEQNPSTPEDPELIAEISRITGKIKPLASSDLDTIIIQGRQLLNISKPFHLPGIGYLQMDQRGKIDFREHVEDDHRKDTGPDPNEPDETVRFGERYRRPSTTASANSRTLAIAALSLLGLALLGWLGYYFYQRAAREDFVQTDLVQQEKAIQDTATTRIPLTETLPAADTAAVSRPVDSVPRPPAPAQPDASSGFNIILEKAGRQRAMKRYAELREWGHQAMMTTSDSVDFKIYIPIEAPLTDSARHRDSISRFFGRKVWVERRNND